MLVRLKRNDSEVLSMFKSKNTDEKSVDTVIGETVFIEGKLKSNNGLQIEGKITGEVECNSSVIVGTKGIVNASITAKILTISGIVNGNVTATEKLIIKPKGKLTGEAKTKSFIVDEGGKFLGKSSMDEDNELNADAAKKEDIKEEDVNLTEETEENTE